VWWSWIANPLLLVAAVANRYGSPRLAFGCALLALIAAPLALVLLSSDGRGFGMNILYPHVGYFLWVASIGCAVASAARGIRRSLSSAG
jgi:hypothetical protein